MSRILIVDDEFLIRYTLEEGLRDRGHETQSAENVEEGLLKARKFHPDVVLLDNLLEHSVGMDEIATFKAADPQIQVILMTAYGSVSQAVEAVKRGAYDYILKPFDIDDIEMAVKRSVEKTRNQESLEYLKGESQEFLGVSPAVQQIRRHIEILGKNSSVSVLIRGETGTGKEVAARLIHDISGRPGLMVRINCGAIPENLLENELFGYERGAFAGAMRTKKGLIEMADGGTVFFDEVGEMPLAMQAKLLTFLDDRKIKRVGGLEDIEVDVRIIAATNRNLEKAVGSLTVTQTVTGTAGGQAQKFIFTVTVAGLPDGTYGDMTFQNGTASFTLRHGESKTASGLPSGAAYEVTIAGAQGYEVSAVGTRGQIPKSGAATAAFTCRKDAAPSQPQPSNPGQKQNPKTGV